MCVCVCPSQPTSSNALPNTRFPIHAGTPAQLDPRSSNTSRRARSTALLPNAPALCAPHLPCPKHRPKPKQPAMHAERKKPVNPLAPIRSLARARARTRGRRPLWVRAGRPQRHQVWVVGLHLRDGEVVGLGARRPQQLHGHDAVGGQARHLQGGGLVGLGCWLIWGVGWFAVGWLVWGWLPWGWLVWSVGWFGVLIGLEYWLVWGWLVWG